MSFDCVGVFDLQIGVAAMVHRFSANLFVPCCVFRFSERGCHLLCSLTVSNCGLVWLAAVLDGGGRVLLRVLYRFRAIRGALFDAWLRAAGIRRSGSPGGRINSVFSFKVLACCTANARGFFFKTVVAGGHAVHAWRCFAPYAIALKCALFLGVFLRDAFSRPVWLVEATVIG